MLSPIIVSVYDRYWHFQKCIDSIKRNRLSSESIIYIVSDAAYRPEHLDSILKVREIASQITGFKEVYNIFREKNLGASKSVLPVVQEVLNRYGSFIFLEDDIVVSSDFLQYMNDGLTYYQKDPRVFAICGFKTMFELPRNYDKDVYFYPCNSPWGFASWKDKWNAINHDYYDRYSELRKDCRKYKEFISIGFYIKGILQADSKKEIVAGDLRVYYHMFQNHMCSVFPVISKTQNWGFDGSGEHCGNKKDWWAKPPLDTRNIQTQFIPFEEYDKQILKNHRKFMDKINGGIFAKCLKYTWVHRLWKKIKI